MKTELAIALLAGLGGMLGWGCADFFAKKTIDAIGDIVSLWWAHVFGTAILLFYAIVRSASGVHFSFPEGGAWAGLIFFGTLQALVYLLVYKGFSKGQVAVLNPIFASFAGIAAILSIIVYGEVVHGYIGVALFTIFLGVLLMNTDPAAFKVRRIRLLSAPGFREIMIATILAALWTLLWDRFVGGNDWLSYTFFMYFFMTVVVYIIARVKKVSLRVGKQSIWGFLFLIGLWEAVAYGAVSLGYSLTTKTSIIALLSGAFSLPVIILARVFLKERVNIFQTVGSILIVIGIIVLSLLH